MIDCFALLEIPRRPWLEPQALKERFLAASGQSHPDRVHSAGTEERQSAQARYADLNAAYNRLREPKERLQHLLELETGAKPPHMQSLPGEWMVLSLGIAQACKAADALIAEKNRTTSPLLQVQLFEKLEGTAETLRRVQQQLNRKVAELNDELQRIDLDWSGAEKPPGANRATLLRRLEELWRLFSYFGRWSSQVQERLVQLSL